MYKEARGYWRQENEWPIARTRYVPMYLRAQGKLEETMATNPQPERDSYVYRASAGITSGILAGGHIQPWAMPLDQRPDEAYSLIYSTPPLEHDVEVTGTPLAKLFVSSSADIAYFVAKLSDVAPDGISKLVSQGALNATHRNSDSEPEALKPGEIYELKFGLRSIAYVFPAGHRIRVNIASADFQNAWPVSRPAVNSLVRGRKFPSQVVLPIVPKQDPALPEPSLLPSPNPLPESVARPEYNITQDLVNQTTTVSSASPGAHVSYTVSNIAPANALLKSDTDFVLPGPDGEVKVQAQTVTESDAEVFRHRVDVVITVGGKPRFKKSWNISVPRILN